MHRFYLPPEHCHGSALQLDEREAHHASHVLRVKPSEPVVVLDGAGNEFLCEIADCSRKTVTLRVKQKTAVPRPRCQITLLQAIPKGKIIESIIQKSVELGAHRIVPLLTERVMTRLDERDREHKRQQWQQVAIEAIKQCGAAWLPVLEAPIPFSAFSLQPSAFDLSLVASLQKDRRHPRECFQEFQSSHGRLPQSVAVWIGPEGDFTPDELEVIQASGAQPISLGRLVLRVETAATYCLSILNYELQATCQLEPKPERRAPSVPGA